ncbi:T9SS type A sorting domain-containing protein [Hymenobacter sp. DH14]|uniref:T9SS type A sorting domain-containing protein n=1 Tax=Hymenobacter cyanobacteriorum TaxID=2926463 RepID=A0A9X1VCA9_9BACT|nr:T9SS type A sorting domain-containing protein [Hymenobacter cyanobacteriorum]MCI1185895.1 T9SS type A sorting domain-containing protein [Hymenobacter cyanobacteriorum]
METPSFFRLFLRLPYHWGLLLLGLLAGPARAQFSTTPAASQFVSNAPGNQFGVQAVADGAGGSFVVWIDKRNGNNSGLGTGIYAQHLNAAGVPLLAANGKRLFQTGSRDIFGMKVVPWQYGYLVAWVQGAFGVGGDTVRCQFYSANGDQQWSIPTVVAYRTLPTVIYESEQGLNIVPTSTGATITHALALNGGSARFTFNKIGPTGVLSYPNNDRQVVVSPNSIFASDYYHTVSDGADGFYMVASAGGFSSPIYAQHFSAAGAATWANYTTISAGGASGRGSDWQPLIDPAGNLYVAWTSNGGDPLVSKVLPSGALGWAGAGYVALSTDPAYQTNPYAIWHNNALWMIWEDARGGSGSFDYKCYAQKIDAAGALAWDPNGVPVYSLSAAYPRPKLAPSDNGSVMAFYSTDTNAANFRAQKILPTGSLAFAAPGVILHSVADNRPYELDYVPVGQPNGSVQVYWSSPGAAPTGRDIVAGRMQNSGTLLSSERAAEALGFVVYPNPAATELKLQFPAADRPTGLHLYDGQGRLVRAFADAAMPLSLRGLPVGLYVLRATMDGQEVSRRVVVE